MSKNRPANLTLRRVFSLTRAMKGKTIKTPEAYLGKCPVKWTVAMPSKLIEAAERMPEAFGLSQNALGEGVKKGESFESVLIEYLSSGMPRKRQGSVHSIALKT